jgi:hypothetical protein
VTKLHVQRIVVEACDLAILNALSDGAEQERVDALMKDLEYERTKLQVMVRGVVRGMN